MREGEYCRRLALGVGVHSIGLDAQAGLEQTLDHVDGFPYTGRNEMPEHRDVVVGHVPVGHRAHLAVAEVVAGQQIVVVEVVLGAVSRDGLAIPPVLG